MRICVFGGAARSVNAAMLAEARELGRQIALKGHGLVFGGGAVGVMGALAEGAAPLGQAIIGVQPRFLAEREPPHPLATDFRVVENMHDRKALMYELSDAFIAAPGGYGTLEEAMEVITWQQLGLHRKPIVFLNTHGFWEPLGRLFDAMHENGLLDQESLSIVQFASTPEEAVALCTQG